MTKRILRKKTTWIAIVALCAILTSAAWASHEKLLLPFPGQPLFHKQPATNDTTPKKSKQQAARPKKESPGNFDRDLDQAMEDLERAITNLKLVLKSNNWKKYHDALKESDLERLSSEINDKMRFDWEQSEEEFNKARKEFELNRGMEDLMRAKKESMWNYDMQKMQKEMELAQLNLERNLGQMDQNLLKMNDELLNAQKNMEKASEEMENLHAFIDELRKDGLINKKGAYDLKIENGELFIDGKKQPDSVTEKYRNKEKYKQYFDKDNNFSIKSDGKDDDEWL